MVQSRHSFRQSRKQLLSRIFVALLVLTGMLTVWVDTAEAATFAAEGYVDYDVNIQIFNLVNQTRRNAGLRPLTYDWSLQDHATQRAAETTFLQAHTRTNGDAFNVDDKGFYTGNECENIQSGQNGKAFGEDTATLIFNCWMASASHRAAILNPAYRSTAVGSWYDLASESQNGYVYSGFAQLFSTEKAKQPRLDGDLTSGLGRRWINLRDDKIGGYAYLSVPSFELSTEISSVQAQTWIHNSAPSLKAAFPDQNFIAHIAENSLIWESSNPFVATVDSGLITGHNAGTATITVKFLDGTEFAAFDIRVRDLDNAYTGVASRNVDVIRLPD